MDFSKLNANEKLAVYGAVASIVGPILASFGFGFGVGWLTALLAIAMLAIVFMPQLSPQTQLPGSKGSLMVVVGGIAAVSAALALLGSLGLLGLFGSNIVFVLGWLLGIAGGLLMGWAGWQEFQAEGGKFIIGTSAAPAAPPAPPAPPAGQAEPMAPPPAAPMPPPATPMPPPEPTAPSEPMARGDESDEERRG
jgi:hypothetical protein